VGILNTSENENCDQAVTSNVFTMIYPYYDWIVTKLKAADAGGTW
jgi:secreted trypsin-like serine protease